MGVRVNIQYCIFTLTPIYSPHLFKFLLNSLNTNELIVFVELNFEMAEDTLVSKKTLDSASRKPNIPIVIRAGINIPRNTSIISEVFLC